MVVDNVRNLISQKEGAEKQIIELQQQLNQLRREHAQFWATFQGKCSKTSHDFSEAPFNKPQEEFPAPHSLGFFKIRSSMGMKSQGHSCPYCRGHIGKSKQLFHETWDGYDRKSFKEWLNQDTSIWPSEKKALFEEAKAEVEQFFAKVAPLKQKIKKLQKLKSKLQKEVENIWKLCDVALD